MNIKNISLKRNVLSICILLFNIILLSVLRDKNTFDIIKWEVMLLIIGIATRPFLFNKTLNSFDNLYAISTSFGIAITFFITWTISATKIISFSSLPIIIILSLFFGMGIFLSNKKIIKYNWNIENIQKYILGFLIIITLINIYVFLKGHHANVFGEEKMMDFGFMQTMYRQQSAIPEDMWFSGTNLNYYYLGQSCAVYLCRLSFIEPKVGYNLMLATIFAMEILGVFEIVCATLNNRNNTNKTFNIFSGVIASIMVVFAGNGHWLKYGIIDKTIAKINGQKYKYWFPDSTRFIGYFPDVPDKTIHEFPSYSFVLGDLHAHVINMMFVLPLIFLLVDYVLSIKPNKIFPNTKKEYFKYLFSPIIISLGLLLGLYQGTNFWDFPIYFGLAGLMILFADCKQYGIKIKVITSVFLRGIIVIGLSLLSIRMFTSHFDMISSNIKFCENHTPFWQFSILWGIPIIITWLYLFVTIVKRKMSATKLSATELAISIISIYALILLIVPEIIYVEDIYGAAYARCNTMFKFVYQAFILFGIAIGLIVGECLYKIKSYTKENQSILKILNISFVAYISIISILLSGYFVHEIKTWYGNPFIIKNYTGIDCTRFLETNIEFVEDKGAIDYINNIDNRQNIHILECAGSSYTANCKVSVFTGACTVVGWHTHEWLWKGNVDLVNERTQEVYNFYSNGDKNYCKEFIKKYDIDYIYIGTSEVKKYPINTNGFSYLGDIVWENGYYRLIKVNKNLL